MLGSTPTILVVDDDWDEGVVITSVLREAGFAVVAADTRGASAAMQRERFAASVIALPDGEETEFLREARRRQSGLKALVVIEPTATRFVAEDDDTLVPRPFDPRQLLGCVFELVLREGEDGAAAHHRDAAELGIAAAEIACLDSRRAAAAAAGATRLMHDLTRQIGETRALHRGLAAATPIGGRAGDGLAGAG